MSNKKITPSSSSSSSTIPSSLKSHVRRKRPRPTSSILFTTLLLNNTNFLIQAVAASYRFAFASSFVLLRFVSEIVGLINYAILYNVLLLLRLNPTYGFDKQYAYDERVARAKTPLAFYYHLVYMCYPYYYMFKCLIQQKGFEDIHIPLDLKATPILYIYGKAKNINFHDWKSLAILEREEREKRSDCRVVAVEGAGHWMYVQKLDVCFDEIRSFIR